MRITVNQYINCWLALTSLNQLSEGIYMNSKIQELAMDLNNWTPIREANVPGMNYQVLLRCLRKRDEDPSLRKCCREVGNRLFLNKPLFGLWMAGELE